MSAGGKNIVFIKWSTNYLLDETKDTDGQIPRIRFEIFLYKIKRQHEHVACKLVFLEVSTCRADGIPSQVAWRGFRERKRRGAGKEGKGRHISRTFR